LDLLILLLLLAAAAGSFRLLRARRRRAMQRAEIFDDLLTLDLSGNAFEPHSLDALPERAAAWLRNALASGQPVSRTADIRYAGHLRAAPADDWLPYRARERVAAGRGFIWEGRVAALGPLFVAGAECFRGNSYESRFELQGLLTVTRETGEDHLRSARARFLLEHVWLPGCLLPELGAAWTATSEDQLAVVPAGWDVPLGLEIGPGGVLRSASVLRFRPETGRMVNFGMAVEREEVFDGHRLPSRISGGWGFGTDDYVEIFRSSVESVRFF
jgi:hypothetical protein